MGERAQSRWSQSKLMLMEVSKANLQQIRISDLNVPDLTFRSLETIKLYSANTVLEF